MYVRLREKTSDTILILTIIILIVVGTFVLRSIAPYVFPSHFIYLGIGAFLFFLLTRIDWDIFYIFSPHLYIFSIFLLITTLIIGQVTRGAVRWIPLGVVNLQPSEVVRAFLLLYWARYITEREINSKRLIKLFLLFFLPFILIIIQPSLGVAILTAIGFLGILLASSIEKKYFLIGLGVFVAIFPLLWFILQPYQKARVITFLDPESDPLGAGYNSIQSMISVGSGRLFGRGLGEGVQTQLAFLPENHTDFIFAAISEELGFLGAILTITLSFALFLNLIGYVSNALDPSARAYTTGVFLILLAQSIIHIGMNMGLFPITGVPLPFVSAGGSSIVGTFISIAIVIKSRKEV
ncbi:hypothetical protein A2715_05525 [Candidatus Woesebacteria bacterium RIFCSPHIGHO2_01_FULL_39_32]|uniref:Probable peptidoglycan glycosyltransferase FtsW n=1 Tax=Candidatus Woesebacteria bacterium RIFCSPLOWO2_01_FULL_39_25 TaxID=1802521 RepID=A0A1F8BLR0_9BACT|nr:MAG: hypothetical protein A2124_03970 [Candidatus Woesebacteria bacterium GWB1_37_5]OGM25480.1 MAG: hypothetical protein A2715_05525 [Candidatus Woesebacteria bacterium RIFCSPHIGHO2_01_FULL_39_32]OGM38747.1 MAG: hypothetical protein A3F01_06235 [Candidatus Woesebacteria bacterium RIFCSPHIGHO2_12_FULL_38_11]OGM65011.1 MAG: hypothetical protein A2893_05135 [Candidatus Woesebacteria bacterium RIFCSPLOWO2_01_FULL_39_25]